MRVAVLVADMYEEPELIYPLYRLREAGHEVVLVGPAAREFRGKHGYPVTADAAAADVDASGFDAVVVPGGFSPDFMRRDPAMVGLVRDLVNSGKTAAAICHGPWMLASADVLRGRRATSVSAIRVDVQNAGAEWVDEPVVVDGPVITARVPADLPAMMAALLGVLEG